MYDLAEVDGVNEEVYEEQRQQWLDALTWEAKSSDKKQLLRLALLERTAAGLNLDALLIDQQKPLAAYAVSKTRENLQLLLEELQ